MGIKIVMTVCFLPCMLIMFGVLYMEGKRKGDILLGVGLWPGADREEEVQAVKKRFQREMRWILLLSCLAFVCTLLPNRTSIIISTQILWLLIIMVVFFVPMARGNRQLKILKRERLKALDAPGEPDQKVYVDMKAAAAPKDKPFLKLSLAGVLLGLIPVIGELFLASGSFYGWWTEAAVATMFLAGLLCLLVQYRFWHMRTDVVSLRSEVNIQLARVRQYQWSRLFSVIIWINTAVTVILWYGMHHPRSMIFVVLAGGLLSLGVAAVAAIVTERNIRQAYRKYAGESGLTTEEDDHWIYGIFYYNKNDSRFMVNNRVGIGTTINMAKPSGKIFSGVILIGTVALLFWAAGMVLLEDFVPISLKVEDNAVISGQYQEEYRIPVGEIENVELVEELPSMSKRVGSAMETIKKGSFMAEGYVSCKVCARIMKPPFLKITTEDGMVYYLNDEDTQVTKQVYWRLTDPKGPVESAQP